MWKKIKILGAEWTIRFDSSDSDPKLEECDGYTDSSVKEIVVDRMDHNGDIYRKKDMESYKKQVIRHELIHAFLAESGLDGNGSAANHWEFNEEMVDWFAIQLPKIFKAFKKLNLL